MMTMKKTLRHTFPKWKKLIYRRASNVTQTFDMQIKGMGDFYSSLKGEDFNIHKKKEASMCSWANDKIAVVKLNSRNLMYSTCESNEQPSQRV